MSNMYQLYWNDTIGMFIQVDTEFKIAYRLLPGNKSGQYNDYFNNRLGCLIDSEFAKIDRFNLDDRDIRLEELHN